jgi:hypothetical protein
MQGVLTSLGSPLALAVRRENHHGKVRNQSKNTGIRPEEYSYFVSWSEADKVFIARVIEFPSHAKQALRFRLSRIGRIGRQPVPVIDI